MEGVCLIVRNIDETNVDEYIEDLIKRTNGKYITQGVSFNKTCKRQMKLLRQALIESSSFSGLIKEMLALQFHHEKTIQNSESLPRENKPKPQTIEFPTFNEEKSLPQSETTPSKKNVLGWV